MLIEGIDNPVLFVILIILLLCFISGLIMCSYIRNTLLSVTQLSPRVHHDFINDVNQFRDELVRRNLLPASRNNEESERRRQNAQINCPICISTSTLPIETNCGHIFCASCIIQYWRHLSSNIFHTNMKCPMCRQLVTVLLPLYTRHDQQQASSSEMAEIFSLISNYNRRFSGAPRSYWDYISDIPILLRHVINEMFSFDGLSIWYRIRFGFMILMALCYFISPLDIIPEALFGIFGLIDDILIVLFLAIYICTMYRQIIVNRR